MANHVKYKGMSLKLYSLMATYSLMINSLWPHFEYWMHKIHNHNSCKKCIFKGLCFWSFNFGLMLASHSKIVLQTALYTMLIVIFSNKNKSDTTSIIICRMLVVYITQHVQPIYLQWQKWHPMFIPHTLFYNTVMSARMGGYGEYKTFFHTGDYIQF